MSVAEAPRLPKSRGNYGAGAVIGLLLLLIPFLEVSAGLPTSHINSQVQGQVYDSSPILEKEVSYDNQICFPVQPTSGEARVVGSLPEGMYDMGAATVRGKAYLVGGANRTGGEPLSTIIEYDPFSNTTKVVHDLSTGIRQASVVAFRDKIYILGGREPDGTVSAIRAFDPVENTSKVVGHLPAARYWGAAAVVGNHIYYGGGVGLQKSDEIFRFDPFSGVSVQVGKLPERTFILTATSVLGRVYFIGGLTASPPPWQSNLIVEYNPLANSTTVVATFPPPPGSDGLEGQTAVTINEMVYIFNGWDEAAVPKVRNEIYGFSPVEREDAVLLGTLPHSVERGAAVTIFGRAYLFGGANLEAGWLNAGITEFTPRTVFRGFPRLVPNDGPIGLSEPDQSSGWQLSSQPIWVCPTSPRLQKNMLP